MNRTTLKTITVLWMIQSLVFPQSLALAELRIPGFTRPNQGFAKPSPTALPVEQNLPAGVTLDRTQDRLVVNQDRDKVVIRWESFDIGEDASTHFNQQGNADWVALNRIADTGRPSQIFGRLTADGKVFLVNKNGILFGEGSTVNVHSLLATSLEPLDEQELLAGTTIRLRGTGGEASILNEGAITTKQGGKVYMVAPNAANAGTIDAQAGSVHLVAGRDVSITGTTQVVNSDPGLAVNVLGGRLSSDAGFVGVWGNVVRQEGLIRTVTTIQKGGTIQLVGRDKVVTGADSQTVAPISDSAQAMHEETTHAQGRINIYSDLIEHHGKIEAPAGVVTMAGADGASSADRIYLAGGSIVSTAGVLFDKAGSENMIKAQLNSNELRDDPLQKNGVLQGTSVTFSATEGSGIGEISGDLVQENVTALERNSIGGEIRLSAEEIILRQGALLDVSGGAVRYSGDGVSSTKLLSGNTIYTLENAPSNLYFQKVLGEYTRTFERHGVVETLSGFYTGGSNSVANYFGSHVEGKNAGKITLLAKRLVLDGTLLASAFNGRFQTGTTELLDAYGYPITRGRARSAGGVIEIGSPGGVVQPQSGLEELNSLVVEEMVVQGAVEAVDAAFDVSTPFPAVRGGKTLIAASLLNDSGAQRLGLYSNTTLTIEKDAAIVLAPGGMNTSAGISTVGGVFEAQAREIIHQGAIFAPGGLVSLRTFDTAGSLDTANLANSFTGYTPGVYLDRGSKIIVAGETVDNWTAGANGRDINYSPILNGGEIMLDDQTWFAEAGGSYHGTPVAGRIDRQGVIVREGALLDVSGGAEITTSGKVSGGNAGSLTLRGANLVLDGEIRGHALTGKKGGQITLHADSLGVVHGNWAPELPAGFAPGDPLAKAPGAPGFTLVDDRLADTGFTRISLMSRDSVTVGSGVTLAPSQVRKAAPDSGKVSADTRNILLGQDDSLADHGLVTVEEHQVGASSISLVGGKKVTELDTGGSAGDIEIEDGALLKAAPGGTVTLEGGSVLVSGTLSALGGTVSLKASISDLVVGATGRILASGYDRPNTTALFAGMDPGSTAHDAGTVSLTSKFGEIRLEAGSLVDISGSRAVKNTLLDRQGNAVTVLEAGAPGSLELNYFDGYLLAGDLKTEGHLPGLPGAAISLSSTNISTPMTLDAALIQEMQSLGFDALGFAGDREIRVAGALNLDIGRKLTLDAPIISGDGQAVTLRADWVELANTYWPSGQAGTTGPGTLSVEADWIDLAGDVALQNFNLVSLLAGKDLRLIETVYKDASGIANWRGKLAVGKDLTLAGDRVYPGKVRFPDGIQDANMYSHFTLDAPNGKVLILPGSGTSTGTIYSAGGKITIQAQDLEHHGALVAPMGGIDLDVSGRLFLAQDSVLSVAGSVPVRYGMLDQGLEIWEIYDRSSTNLSNKIAVTGAPDKAVDLNGAEIVIQEGSLVDVSGGGSVYATRFIGSSSGSINPFEPPSSLNLPERFVVVPGVDLPGRTLVITQGSSELPAGTYSIMAEDLAMEYGFLDKAVLVSTLASQPRELTPSGYRTPEGYNVVAGYEGYSGSSVSSPRSFGYSVRPASQAAAEGLFPRRTFVSGRSGDLSLTAPTTIVDGTIRARLVDGFIGGTFGVSGAESAVVVGQTSLPSTFAFGDVIPVGLRNKSNVFAESVSRSGLGEIKIGDVAVTQFAEVAPNVDLEANSITLAAAQKVTIGQGAQVRATAEDGFVSLISPQGEVLVETGAQVFAQKLMNIEAGSMSLLGGLSTGGSTLRLTSDLIRIVDAGYVPTANDALYLYEDLRNMDGFDTIELTASNGIEFIGDVDLAVAESLSFKAPVIMGADQVRAQAGHISLLGLTASGATPGMGPGSGTALFSAESMTIGPNALVVNGFDQVGLEAVGDIIFSGQGSLATQGDLTLTAARVTNAPTITESASGVLQYTPGAFTVQAGSSASQRALNILGGFGQAGSTLIPGGTLDFSGRTVLISGLIDTQSARIKIRGLETVTLAPGGVVQSLGSEDSPAGRITIISDNGDVVIGPGALVDVSAGTQGDAGSVILAAAQGQVDVQGSLMGQAQGTGLAGTLAVDTGTLSSLSGLAGVLSGSGLTREVAIRVRQGDVTLGAADTIQAQEFTLSADQGNITLLGTIDASGEEGGRVRVLAKNNLSFTSGQIDASGQIKGGYVLLGADEGQLTFGAGALVNVSGGTGDGGTVHFRARRAANNQGMNMVLSGQVLGAANRLAEGFRVYDNQAVLNTALYRSEAEAFYAAVAKPAGYTVLPGIEIRNANDLTVASAWDLTSWNFGTATDPIPGALTLRAGNNLTINADLSSRQVGSTGSTGYQQNLQQDPRVDSWIINLAAGSDLSAADYLAVNTRAASQTGRNLTIAQERGVYTESGPLSFASGGDTVVGSSAVTAARNWMGYTTHVGLGTFDGDIQGFVGTTLNLGNGKTTSPASTTGGVIISATGDIDLQAGNLILASSSGKGAIVTTGYRDIDQVLAGLDPQVATLYRDVIIAQTQGHWWHFGQGGDISLDVAGDIAGAVDLNRWAAAYTENDLALLGVPQAQWPDLYAGPDGVEKYWLAKYSTPMLAGQNPSSGSIKDKSMIGVATMAGGDLVIQAGGNAVLQAGTFGLGQDTRLKVTAGKNLDGLFMAREGRADLTALGNFGTTASVTNQFVETERARINLSALGNVTLNGVVNPSAFMAGISRYEPGLSALSLNAGYGDVIIKDTLYPGSKIVNESAIYTLYPPDVDIRAGRDIKISTLSLAPSETGSLTLIAGRDITRSGSAGNGIIRITDMDPDSFYGVDLYALGSSGQKAVANQLSRGYLDLIHAGDPNPVIITAGRDITNITFDLSKSARIIADRDITDFNYMVQNLADSDISLLKAGRDIIPITATTATSAGIFQYGPGGLMVQAGNTINLGASGGIQSLGNSGTGSGDARSKLPDQSAVLLVTAGYDKDFDFDEVRLFFDNPTVEADSLQELGQLYTETKEHLPSQAAEYLTQARELIATLLEGHESGETNGGNILMEKTRILSRDNGGDIFMLARGKVVVGRSNLALPGEQAQAQNDSLGIFAERFGHIKIFASRDVDVFESRVMSMFGGDISIWSDHGNVNAGKGSKTQVSSPMSTGGEFKPPAVGSGVRTSTYDPDGPEGPLTAPLQGDAYVFAPEGIIDAGEAGISARNVYLGATSILNAQNVQAAGLSVGVPVSVSGTSGIGALSGSSGLSDATKNLENTGLAAARQRAEQMSNAQQFGRFLDVRVTSYLE